ARRSRLRGAPRPGPRGEVDGSRRLRGRHDRVGLPLRRQLELRAPRPRGQRVGFRGVFHTVRENEFAIQTFEFLGYPDTVSIESLRFEDLGNGRSRLSGHAVYPTLEARDGMVASGMETG